jgi:uncharacterized protein
MTSPSSPTVERDPGTGGATVVLSFSAGVDRQAFARWSLRNIEAARTAQGFLSGQVGMEATELDWSIALTFDTEEHLHLWLDGTDRRALLAEGRALGFHREGADVIVAPGRSPGTGVGVFRHLVATGREPEFVAVQRRLLELSATFPGYEGAALLRPGEEGGDWISLLRFRTDHQLLAWMDSEQRQQALPTLRSQLSKDFSVVTRSTPFGSIVRVEDGATKMTPNWKSAMLVLLVLYPTVMTLSRFLGPVLDGAGASPWLSMWLSQIVSVALMTWIFMPAVTGWFRRWLDPSSGAGLRITLIGVLVILAVYVATLTLFATVPWLQFWTHPN